MALVTVLHILVCADRAHRDKKKNNKTRVRVTKVRTLRRILCILRESIT